MADNNKEMKKLEGKQAAQNKKIETCKKDIQRLNQADQELERIQGEINTQKDALDNLCSVDSTWKGTTKFTYDSDMDSEVIAEYTACAKHIDSLKQEISAKRMRLNSDIALAETELRKIMGQMLAL